MLPSAVCGSAAPGGPKNPHVCVLNLAGSVSGHEAFTNPQVDGLRDFRLLPPAGLKRKHAPFLRAGRPKDARDPPLRAGIPAPGAALPSAYCIQPTTLPSAYSPPRLYTPSARDFPLTGTSVAHDSSRICTLNVHGFSCAAQCAPSTPHIPHKLVLLRFGAGRVPVKPAGHHGTRPAGLRPGLSPAGLFRIPRVRFHVGHVGDGEERHGKARVLTRVVMLSGKREKRSDRPAQIRLFTTQVI